MAFDMEFEQPSQEIIQIGVCVGDTQIPGTMLATKVWYVLPRSGQPLSEFIIGLTGITQETMDREGIPLEQAYAELCAMVKEEQVMLHPVVWGSGDCRALRAQLGLDNERFIFGRREVDAKTLYVSYCIANGLSYRAGLNKALIKLGLSFIGKKHDAEDDAWNTWRIYTELLSKLNEYNNV